MCCLDNVEDIPNRPLNTFIFSYLETVFITRGVYGVVITAKICVKSFVHSKDDGSVALFYCRNIREMVLLKKCSGNCISIGNFI